jgi:hypothetical protein
LIGTTLLQLPVCLGKSLRVQGRSIWKLIEDLWEGLFSDD